MLIRKFKLFNVTMEMNSTTPNFKDFMSKLQKPSCDAYSNLFESAGVVPVGSFVVQLLSLT